MSDHRPIFHLLLHKFQLRAQFDQSDRDALLALPCRSRKIEPAGYIVREGEFPDQSCLVVSGFAFRHKTTIEGARQIVSVHVPGDFVDLAGALLNVSDHNVQALTRCDIAFVPRAAIQELILSHPRVGVAMWIDTLIDASVFREWILNVGRRDARSRIAHLLCEFARRLELVGLADEYGYELPMTQEQIADATGLTSVHVNRVLKALSSEGLIVRNRRFVGIPDWEALRRVAGFSETYLHLDQMREEPPGESIWEKAARRA